MEKLSFALHRIFNLKDESEIYSEKEFWKILDRERARVDRNEQVFSLVLFDVKKIISDKKSLSFLTQALLNRARATDVVGWVRGNKIAALLPETSREGAWKFATDVSLAISYLHNVIDYHVYTYPQDKVFQKIKTRDSSRNIDFYSWDQVRAFWDGVPMNGRGKNSQIPVALHKENAASNGKNGKVLTYLRKPIPLWKRAIDIFGASVGLVLFSPIFLLMAVYIKLVSPGPIFYKQIRIGLDGKPFQFWKFRTMKPQSDEKVHENYLKQLMKKDVPMTKLDLKNDDRIIPFGKLIRQSGLDELPQLINVLRGEMSLIGPRPSLPYEVEGFLPWHKRRFDVLPGMTGLWQVNGKNRTTFHQMMKFDVAYAKQYSFINDLMILLKTGPAIFRMVRDLLQLEPQVSFDSTNRRV